MAITFSRVKTKPTNTRLKLDSKIILDARLEARLVHLCQFQASDKWKLLYRGSDHGFSAFNFHAKCDNTPNTLTIIKSKMGHVFGGYTRATWESPHSLGSFKFDQEAFLFSLINAERKPIKMKISKDREEYAIGFNSRLGPIFGAGYDIFISDNSMMNESSYSNLGHSYQHPKYKFGSNEAQVFLAGSHNFRVADIEIYQKQ
jgi:hypothetical protein